MDLTQEKFNEIMGALDASIAPDEDTRKTIACALLGHSKIVETCFGYINCARCGIRLGDTLGGAYSLEDTVIVGHNCQTCRVNYEKLDWRHKVMTPDPFAEKAGEGDG
jgi:hypothetical protein